ncbi:VCBS repeat-containing protein [Aliifodinibius salicampi]|uniref:VCBS repeat-containing protein n=1 Tax=Fodinibius salicampi TaxID=1920655 RepID=A0ABT3Q1L3_9BACT|nr:VCBS repeat-containing protein [Fodinibius salicampi]MCW9713992.1 VCBS repeat-containing protein [Fodinibius salicampi]
MRTFKNFSLFILALALTACNIEAVDGDDDDDPDTEVYYRNVSADYLPSGLSGSTQKAKAADINGDGFPDIVLAINGQPNKILLNDGSGDFSHISPVQLSSQGYTTQDLSIADFNNNGNPDIIFVSGQGNPNELYINIGGGSFSDISNRIPVSNNSTSVETWDIDNDGAVDIFIGNIGQNTILINNGNAFFTNQTDQRIPIRFTDTEDFTFGDVTGNQWWDIVTANRDNNRLYLNSGSGFFTDQTQFRIPFIQTAEESSHISLVDIDGDGDLDLYIGNSTLENSPYVQDRLLINDGEGFFSDETGNRLPQITTNTSDAAFVDLDNDGNNNNRDFDVVLGNPNGGLWILINNGNGNFNNQTSNWIEEDYFPQVNDIEVADFNRDGFWDLYLSVQNNPDQLLLQRN